MSDLKTTFLFKPCSKCGEKKVCRQVSGSEACRVLAYTPFMMGFGDVTAYLCSDCDQVMQEENAAVEEGKQFCADMVAGPPIVIPNPDGSLPTGKVYGRAVVVDLGPFGITLDVASDATGTP